MDAIGLIVYDSYLYGILVGLLSFELPLSFQTHQAEIGPDFSVIVVQDICL